MPGKDECDGDQNTNETDTRPASKVARLIEEYGLDGLGGDLEQRWTDTGDERMSLRDLAAYFNRQLLSQRLADTGQHPLAGEVENIYRLLTDDGVSAANQTRTQRRLERDGVDVDDLRADFITYQAIRTYLKEHRNAEYPTDNRDRTVIETENIQRLRGRIQTVVEDKLDKLQNTDAIVAKDYRTFVEITIFCEHCGDQYPVEEFLEHDGCHCSDISE